MIYILDVMMNCITKTSFAGLCWHRLRSMKALEADITKLDSLYNDLGEVMAEGERDDFNDTWFACKTKCLFTFSSS